MYVMGFNVNVDGDNGVREGRIRFKKCECMDDVAARRRALFEVQRCGLWGSGVIGLVAGEKTSFGGFCVQYWELYGDPGGAIGYAYAPRERKDDSYLPCLSIMLDRQKEISGISVCSPILESRLCLFRAADYSTLPYLLCMVLTAQISYYCTHRVWCASTAQQLPE